MEPEAVMPKILLAHDGELEDVRALLDDLGAAFEERIGRRGPDENEESPPEVVIASPQRLLERRRERGAPTRVAVLSHGTRTLTTMLRRSGVDYVVRRPVHPTALRLLLLHLLYSGPEKRRRQRVSVGAAVRYRDGVWNRRAILADLSQRGCRLLTSRELRRDGVIRLRLPGSLTGGRALGLRGRVIRTSAAGGDESMARSAAVIFEGLDRETLVRLNALVAEFARGPARLASATSAAAPPPGPDADAMEPINAIEVATRVEAFEAVAPVEETCAPAPDDVPDAPDAPEEEEPGERRRGPRHSYDRSVITLGREAARVVIGRDISLGGMRIDPNPGLSLGDELELAIHARERNEPLVIPCRVERDDGPAGLVLGFAELDGPAQEELVAVIHDLPVLSAGSEVDEASSDRVVSEIVARNPAA